MSERTRAWGPLTGLLLILLGAVGWWIASASDAAKLPVHGFCTLALLIALFAIFCELLPCALERSSCNTESPKRLHQLGALERINKWTLRWSLGAGFSMDTGTA
jgi:heme A synthase